MDIEIVHFPNVYLDIIYLAGRNCFGIESLNQDVFEAEKARFVKKLIENKHYSVIEHVNISIFIKNVSRSFLAQLTRHRLAAYSVKSQHFVKHDDFRYKKLETNLMTQEYIYLMDKINEFYKEACELGVPKYVAREVLPNSALTNIFMTANVRTYRHIIKQRITSENTPEIRNFSRILLRKLKIRLPELFFDL